MNEEIPTSTDVLTDPREQANFIFNEVNLLIASALRSVDIVSGDVNLDVKATYPCITLSTARD